MTLTFWWGSYSASKRPLFLARFNSHFFYGGIFFERERESRIAFRIHGFLSCDAGGDDEVRSV